MPTKRFLEIADKDLAWRKKEISSLFLIYKQTPSEDVIGKALILLLYSHWEGYVKNISVEYIQLLNNLKIQVKKLKVHLQALALNSLITNCLQAKNSTYPAVEFLQKHEDLCLKEFKVNILPKGKRGKCNQIINTKNNLNFEAYNNIATTIGFPPFGTEDIKQKNLINNTLLESRNAIAHGSKIDSSSHIDINLESISLLKNNIFDLLDDFNNKIVCLAENKHFYIEN